MKKNILLSGLTVFLLGFGLSLQAQFDDLYYDESSFTEEINVNDFDEAADYTAYQDESTITDYDLDEYDDYVSYQSNGYDLDAYQYTNRLNRYRLAAFANNYYGPSIALGFGNDFYGNINRAAAFDPFFRSYLRQQLLFGPSYGRLYSTFGPYADPFSPFYAGGFNRFGGNGFNNFGIGGFNSFGGGFNSFGGGFASSAYYCPPYAVNNLTVINNNSRVNDNNRVSSARATNSTTRLNSVRPTKTYATKTTSNRNSIAVRDNDRSDSRSSAVSSTRSVRPSSTTERVSRSVSDSRSRSYNPSSSSSRSYNPTSTQRSTRSFTPSNSSSRSSFSPSSSSRSASSAPRTSSSSSTRSVRRP